MNEEVEVKNVTTEMSTIHFKNLLDTLELENNAEFSDTTDVNNQFKIEAEKIKEAIITCKNRRALGIVDIPNEIWRKKITNLCIIITVTIFKNENKKNLTNYGEITLLSSVSMLLIKILSEKDSKQTFLENNKVSGKIDQLWTLYLYIFFYYSNSLFYFSFVDLK